MSVLCPNNPSHSSKTSIASVERASSNIASIFLVLSPTHLLRSSLQLTTYKGTVLLASFE